jgi:hypothetical protein
LVGTSDTMRLIETNESISFLVEIGLAVSTLRSWCGSIGVRDRFWGGRSFFGQWFWLY